VKLEAARIRRGKTMKVSVTKGMAVVCPCGTPFKLVKMDLDGVFYFECPSCSIRNAWVPPEHSGVIDSDWLYGLVPRHSQIEVVADRPELEGVAQTIRATLVAHQRPV